MTAGLNNSKGRRVSVVIPAYNEEVGIGRVIESVRKNLESLGICLTGNFDKGIDTPNEKQINSLRNLLYEKATQYKIPLSNIVPHRKFSTKSCYGNSLSDNWASKLVLSKFQQLILALLDLLQRIKGRS